MMLDKTNIELINEFSNAKPLPMGDIKSMARKPASCKTKIHFFYD